MYDVIIRCIFIVVMEYYKILLFRECDLILIFDCIWLKLRVEKMRYLGEIVYDDMYIKIVFFIEIFLDIVRLFC